MLRYTALGREYELALLHTPLSINVAARDLNPRKGLQPKESPHAPTTVLRPVLAVESFKGLHIFVVETLPVIAYDEPADRLRICERLVIFAEVQRLLFFTKDPDLYTCRVHIIMGLVDCLNGVNDRFEKRQQSPALGE
jgi:hypothetical protein